MRMMALVFSGVLLVAAVVHAHTDITPADVKAMIDAGGPLTIVDVREESEYCDSTYSPPGHIPGALNMPWYSGGLEENYSELPMDEDIVVVCRSGGRSNQAANFLDGVGFTRIFDMLGGMNAWDYETDLCWQASVYGADAALSGLALEVSGPNPFSSETGIVYAVPAEAGGVLLSVYDTRGRLVKIILEGSVAAGTHHARWDGKDETGRAVSSGVYFYRLTWKDESRACRVVLAR
jgi:rhodanese-related sulfurtransferase